MGAGSGPGALSRQYETSSGLTARMSLHDRFGSNRVRWQAWVFDQMALAQGERVLEAGCGPGMLWRENLARLPDLRLTLCDRSAGMVREARVHLRQGPGFSIADVQALPFPSGAFDVAIANHMLYHVADLDAGIAELRRVLRPGGRLFAATNGPAHMRESLALAARHLGYDANGAIAADFTLESGMAPLRRHFEEVLVVRPPAEPLLVTQLEPLLEYIASIGPYPRATEASWAALREEVAREISLRGAFEINRESGLFIATAPA